VPAATLTTRAPGRPFRSKRLLGLAGDERLVEQIRRGNELAFEVAFERHGAGILGFCRHMLGSPEEAEDAVQHTFASAFRDLQRGSERQIALKPWLYTIARNRCLSLLRQRREHAAELQELPTDGLQEQVERRAELRELLADLGELPEEQRAALLLAEAAGMSHADVAGVLGCEVARVKALVFRARSGLIERRDARETPCEEIREQLANLRGGALRRNQLRHHLRGCAGCRDFEGKVKEQRAMLAAALPVLPSVGLKASVLGTLGLGGGTAGGGAALGLGGVGAGATLAKVTIVGVLAAGGGVAGDAVLDERADRAPATPATNAAPPAGVGKPSGVAEPSGPPVSARKIAAERRSAASGQERRGSKVRGRRVKPQGPAGARRNGLERPRAGANPRARSRAQGVARGPIEAPPATTPVRRGPPAERGVQRSVRGSKPPARSRGSTRRSAATPAVPRVMKRPK
jgi:RNA polymerase sigma factor (sigma-70 family)